MATVELSRASVEDLDRLILTHSLPDDTRRRVARSLRVLEQFPLAGVAPAVLISVQDARSSTAAR